MPEKLPKGWVRTTLGEVCAMNPRMPFDKPLPDQTKVSFVPMAAVEEESGRLDASQIRTLGSVRRGYTSFIDQFYRELTLLRDKVQEQKPKASEAKSWPLRAHVFLRPKKGAEK
jgi:hypothetical protein